MPNYADWSQPEEYDFEFAPGKYVRLRPLDAETLLTSGILKHMDTLTSLVDEEHVKPAQDKRRVPTDRSPKKLTRAQLEAKQKSETNATLKKLAENPEDVKRLMFMIDVCLVSAVVTPTMTSAYVTGANADDFEKIPKEDRVKGLRYTDYVPFQDAMSIFGEVSKGISDKKSVLEGSESDMDALEAGEGLEDPS